MVSVNCLLITEKHLQGINDNAPHIYIYCSFKFYIEEGLKDYQLGHIFY
jgi:hypothetical protein